jgi:transcriptional regulator with XRE-family HTH domain
VKLITIRRRDGVRTVIMALWAHSGLTQTELAGRSGVHISTLQHMKTADREIGVEVLMKLLEVLGGRLVIAVPDETGAKLASSTLKKR